MIRCAVLATVVAALIAVHPRAATAPATGVSVSGTVSGSDQGFLTGASILIDGPEHRAGKTDADGRFAFTDVPKGRYQIAVSAEGYLGIERQMEVGDAAVSVDIVLLRLPGLQGN